MNYRIEFTIRGKTGHYRHSGTDAGAERKALRALNNLADRGTSVDVYNDRGMHVMTLRKSRGVVDVTYTNERLTA